ncbi:unannotated protein [freshwater metagenome]|uniref:Unannotated protein n=1 Tax=freshwater metagenome TaxID=449393 RepID=A0A6J7FLD4_9ZZZZ
MELNSLFGLPAHPILVHAAVVLVPLAAIGLVLIALVPKLRPKYATLVAIFATLSAGSVGVAQGSGESLQEAVRNSVKDPALLRTHTQMGEDLLPWAAGMFVVAAFIFVVEFMRRRDKPLKLPVQATNIAIMVLSVVVAAGSVYMVIKIGHSGAKSTWNAVNTDG